MEVTSNGRNGVFPSTARFAPYDIGVAAFATSKIIIQKNTVSEKKSLEAVLFIISNRMKEAK